MRYLLLLLLFLPFNSFAVNYALVWHFKMSGVREDNTPITLDEIATLSAYRYDCANLTVRLNRVVYFDKQVMINNTAGDNLQYIIHNEPKMCLKATVTDHDGRTSRESELFIIYDKDMPKPTECVIATQ